MSYSGHNFSSVMSIILVWSVLKIIFGTNSWFKKEGKTRINIIAYPEIQFHVPVVHGAMGCRQKKTTFS